MLACQAVFSPIFVEAFVLNFLAEWGDRSQIATIGAQAKSCWHCQSLLKDRLGLLLRLRARKELLLVPTARHSHWATISLLCSIVSACPSCQLPAAKYLCSATAPSSVPAPHVCTRCRAFAVCMRGRSVSISAGSARDLQAQSTLVN